MIKSLQNAALPIALFFLKALELSATMNVLNNTGRLTSWVA